MNDGDLPGDVGEIQRFLNRSISTPHNRHLLTSVEEAIAGCAGAHPTTHVRLLRGKSKVFRTGTGCDNQCIAGVFAGITDQSKRPALQMHGVNLVEQDFGPEALGMLLKPCH